MRLVRGSNPGSSSSPWRSTIFWLVVVFLIITFAPDLGAGYGATAQKQSVTTIPDNTTGDDDTTGSPDQSDNQLITWTVMRHGGYNDSFQCWMLVLNRVEGPHNETTSDFCAKDKTDYDSHADGSQYTTKGSWLNNVIQNAKPHDNA